MLQHNDRAAARWLEGSDSEHLLICCFTVSISFINEMLTVPMHTSQQDADVN